MTVKKAFGKIHLWLGFAAGLVVFVSLLAASVFVWEKELNEWYHHDKIFVAQVKAHVLPFDSLAATAKKASVNHSITALNIDRDPEKAYVFMNYKVSKDTGWSWASGMDDYSKIYVNQYTGKFLGRVDLRYDWIFCTRMLHQCLLLNYDVGHYIVGGATIIIFIMVVTGIVLWWPKNKAALKQRLWFRWKKSTRWKRKNYDLHNIGGIYTFFFILIFAVTGLVWTFDWWTDGIYRLLGNDPAKVFARPPAPEPSRDAVSSVYDKVIADAMKRKPSWEDIGVSISKEEQKGKRGINVYLKYTSGKSGWDESDYYTYHPANGQLYFTNTQDQKTLGAKWRNSNYAIHVGSIYGLPTKLLATFISLFCASLPLSGFLIWWGRRKKAKSTGKPQRNHVERKPDLSMNLIPPAPSGKAIH